MLSAPAAELVTDPLIESLRAREFGRLDRDRLAYLDYTGSALYAERQVREHHAVLAAGVFGNPHAGHGPSVVSTELIERARSDVLRFFDADPGRYLVCFTANASSAIKLVAESYPFGPRSTLVLSADNHNSVNGIREYARRARTPVTYVPLDDDLRLDDAVACLSAVQRRAGSPAAPRLFAFPAQSNFSGVKHPLVLIDEAHRFGFDVLLDAAAFAPSNPLNLRAVEPAFVAVSFYKIFGYPTGVGALLVRRDAARRLTRPWFAGGTVDFVSVQNDTHGLRETAEAFEDGTPDFLSLAALSSGFALLAEIGMSRIQAHVRRLTARLLEGLVELTHAGGGAPLVRLYGPRDLRARGGTVAFNVLGRDGIAIPYPVVEVRARQMGVAMRGGCFCNPGAAEHAFGFDRARAATCLRSARRDGFTVEKFAACLGERTAVGALRASVGLANHGGDVQRALSLVASFTE